MFRHHSTEQSATSCAATKRLWGTAITRSLVATYVRLCLALTIFAGAISWYRWDVGLSLLMGGLVHLLPNMYFARQLYRFSGAAAAPSIEQSIYRGEVGKFLMTGAGFAAAFALMDFIVPAALFGGFGLMLSCHTIAVARMSR